MEKELSINELTVLLVDRNGKVPDIIQSGLNQSTTGTLVLADITYDDTEIHGFSNATLVVYTKYCAKPPTATKEDLSISVNTLVDALHVNAGDIQSVARIQSKLAGDVNVGINIIKKAGYLVKGVRSSTNKDFEAIPLGGGEVWIRTKAVATGAVYIRECGITTGKGISPETMFQLLIGQESEFILTGLKVAGIYAIREASILPIPRSSGGGSEPTNVNEPATRASISKTHKRIYAAVDGIETSNYVWGDWIYFVVL